jgi:hypothetical protein
MSLDVIDFSPDLPCGESSWDDWSVGVAIERGGQGVKVRRAAKIVKATRIVPVRGLCVRTRTYIRDIVMSYVSVRACAYP